MYNFSNGFCMEYAEALYWAFCRPENTALLALFGSRDQGEEIVCIHVVLAVESGNNSLQIDETEISLDLLMRWEQSWLAVEKMTASEDLETWEEIFATPEDLWQYLDREEFRDRDPGAIVEAVRHIEKRPELDLLGIRQKVY